MLRMPNELFRDRFFCHSLVKNLELVRQSEVIAHGFSDIASILNLVDTAQYPESRKEIEIIMGKSTKTVEVHFIGWKTHILATNVMPSIGSLTIIRDINIQRVV